MTQSEWETKFTSWAKPNSETEDAKCSNAESMIKSAISNDLKLSKMNIKVFAQGSYKNNTNVRLNSDVDICVLYTDNVFFYNLPTGKAKEDFNISSSEVKFSDYKNDVENALVIKFTRAGVTRGKKAFDIHSNSYRVDADAVPCFIHRRYTGQTNLDGSFHFLSGTQFTSDDGKVVVNWPEQNLANGIAKNNATNYSYKKLVRILKKLNLEMIGSGIEISKKIPSFLIECLVWNVPNPTITGYNTYYETLRQAIVFLYNKTKDFEKCKEWGEVNELKYLFVG